MNTMIMLNRSGTLTATTNNKNLIKINKKNRFLYRPFKWEDLPQLKILQNQLFPVQYFDNFYKRLLNDSFITLLVWQKCNSNSDNSNNNNNNNNNEINNNNNDECNIENSNNNNLGDSSLQIDFNDDNNSSENENDNDGGKREFINSQYELVGVATGRITKDQGLCSLFYQNYDGYLMTFGIKEQYRSKGIGSELLNNICKLFYKRCCDKVYLHVKKGNNSALMFYIKNGFVLDNEIVNYYKIDNIRYNALSMSKDLRPKERKSNWHSFILLLKQPNQDFDDDDDDEEYENLIDSSNNKNKNIVTRSNEIANRKRLNFYIVIILIIFLFISLSLVALNNNNNKINNNSNNININININNNNNNNN